MKFGALPVDDAKGAILVHSTMAGKKRLKKGTRIADGEIALLLNAGVKTIIAATLEKGDVGEDEAAHLLAGAFASPEITAKAPATGRVNLHAAAAGVFKVDAGIINRINSIDPAITVATLPDFSAVLPGQMVATVKIIPFATRKSAVERCIEIAGKNRATVVCRFRPHRAGLVQTVLPTVKNTTLDKTRAVTDARLARSGSAIVEELRVGHDARAIADGLLALEPRTDVLLVFGASAVADRRDVIPRAIELAGGTVTRFGMPVDPGNLLVLGEMNGKPVLGAPGCARSPKENGFDWVLDRLLAGMDVTGEDIAGMGVGGLLMEIPNRPEPREGDDAAKPVPVHAVVLAAGQSTRMGGANKLLAQFDGVPLIRKTLEAALESRATGVTIVTGHQRREVAAALQGLDITPTFNPHYSKGLSTSLIAGIGSVPEASAGAMIMLGDMPALCASDLDRLIDAFEACSGSAVVRASDGARRGNPVIVPRVLFGQVKNLSGDTGARHLVEASTVPVIDVEIGAAASLDVDTPEALAEAGGKFK